MLFVGPVDQGVSFAVAKGGARRGRHRRPHALDQRAARHRRRSRTACGAIPAFAATWASDHIADLGDALAKELAAGRQDAALGRARQDHRPGARGLGDAACRRRRRRPVGRAAARPDEDASSPACTAGSRDRACRPSGPRRPARLPSAIPAFSLAGLSTVDSVDTSAGRLGLVLLLAGGEPGQLRRRRDRRTTACCRRSLPSSRRGERPAERPATVLVAARDEEGRIGADGRGAPRRSSPTR